MVLSLLNLFRAFCRWLFGARPTYICVRFWRECIYSLLFGGRHAEQEMIKRPSGRTI